MLSTYVYESAGLFVHAMITTLAKKYIFADGYYPGRRGKGFRTCLDLHGPIM
jgi:hypothetical protein